MLDDGVAEGRAGAGAEVDYASGHSGFLEDLDKFGGHGGSVGGRFENDRVAAGDGHRRHAAHDGEGEVPGRNYYAHAQRDIVQFAAFSGVLDGRCDGGQAQRFARIKFKKVNEFSHVGVGLGPVFTCLEGEPCAKFEVPVTDDFSRVE